MGCSGAEPATCSPGPSWSPCSRTQSSGGCWVPIPPSCHPYTCTVGLAGASQPCPGSQRARPPCEELAVPAGRAADELRHLLHVVGGQQHDLLILREVLVEDAVQQVLPPQLGGPGAALSPHGPWLPPPTLCPRPMPGRHRSSPLPTRRSASTGPSPLAGGSGPLHLWSGLQASLRPRQSSC